MTRRDMIIIAILVNAGLLAVLFMMAINSDTEKVSESIQIHHPIAEVAIPNNPSGAPEPAFIPPIPIDEGDDALNEFNAAPAPLPVLEETLPTTETSDAVAEVTDHTPTPLPQTPPKESEKKMVEVTVKRGDSLDKIARANGTTIKAIKQANDLTSSRLDIGQVLKVPVGEKKSAEKSSTKAKKADKTVVASSDVEYYVIKKGDNPWKIARQFHIKVDDLLKLNNLDEEKARNLKAGDKIRVK